MVQDGTLDGAKVVNETETRTGDLVGAHDAYQAPASDGTAEPLREAAREERAPTWLAAHRSQLFTALAVVALLIFGCLTVLVSDGLTSGTDLAVTRAIQSLTFPGVGPLMIGVSWIGFLPQSTIVVVVVTALFWLAGYRLEAMFAVAAAASFILTDTIKQVMGRPRPSSDLVHVFASISGQSFPSGHVLFYVTFFGFLTYVAYALLKRGPLRTMLLWILGLLIVLVGPSRIWMGQHWASDALASYTLGFAYLVMLTEIYSRYRFSRSGATRDTG
jgi:membrane-associated phospholipid phosphatase